ncbi:hypothetical protein AYI72_03910 [Shewanella algae]|uniref:hypothetical protein n=1 Tax=Shewanella TaxID=22 RepID=UPI000E330773|nr:MULTISPECIES: hypothetical protein [Shewanella]AXQ14602.1 hypothetical protein BS332_10170 [Shewanella algae]MBO2559555.1 hypothetical protein [Shewanella algae]MBO2602047.1 hypothetical protein [Shewanella algae]MBO2618863.1 hypothetical protein [Shewanella algae]MBO2669308.1 hypothetical protein [Shewanella algae]
MSISRPIPLVLLCILYLVLAVVALWRTISTGAVDLFTLGVIPVLVGIVMRTSWSLWALRIYLFIQTLGLMAFATTALVALQITPQDVKLELAGRNIPLLPLATVLLALLLFQYWVAFSGRTKRFLQQEKSD